ncbi:DUF2793 domain-containing protein [Lichenihabitans sp. PAMC28606]|uniref:DUF2793 domain-containing protein n=1 Tax=Lichenihabitans sp. PAMC28606 TaxID=2880932 RepID=UPI001D0A43C0|nr:DUF2793 domain-containing protein [Lichenihabitans sp. PAMC28606]UDL93982.1 DUF2793 domain-containing protein [Lichenihabitans sp. PAMC28606]
MSQTPNLHLPFLDANQNQKTVTHNAALSILDALVQCAIRSATLTAPPAAPGDGQCWIVASGGTGLWAGHDLNVAAWQDGAWAFYPPGPGTLAYDVATSVPLIWTGSAWVPLGSALGPLQLAALGIGTAPDVGNPLSATLNNILLNALGTGSSGSGDLRVKLNKQAAGNTASFLFQDGFSGRAEIGLTGDDDFHFKVSADGSTFRDGLTITAATGALTPIAYAVAALPAGTLGAMIFVFNARKIGEAADAGTGTMAVFSGGAWRRLSDDSAVAA